MRILHILLNLTSRGNGIVNVAVDLAIEQAKAGHEVLVVAGEGDYGKLVESFGVRHLRLDQSRTASNLIRATFQLHAIVRDFHPDVIHAHMRTGLILAWVCSRFPRVPLVAHLHNVHDPESALMRIADRVIAVSASVKESMSHHISPAKFRVILNGPLGSARTPDISTLEPKQLQHPAIVTVAGLFHRKGIAELIEAFELIADDSPKAHLYVVGDGPQGDLFRSQAAVSPVAERIHFEGWQSTPQAWMLACDVFVLVSRRESFGLVLLEARQAGCAIVATNVDGIPQALAGGEAGLLVPPKDPVALAEALRGLLSQDSLRKEWQDRAVQGLEMFSCAQMASEVEALYRELLS